MYKVNYQPTQTTTNTNTTNTSCRTSINQDSDETVPEAQDTADGVEDVMLGSTVARDEDGTEIMECIR